MNKNLLKTVVVKSQVKRYLLDLKLSYDEILYRLYDIHLIKISKEELLDFIKTYKLDEN